MKHLGWFGSLAIVLATSSPASVEAHSTPVAPPAQSAPKPPTPKPSANPSFVGTLIQVRPPSSAEVRILDGANLIARFSGPGSVTVASGRTYTVIAERSGATLWSGTVPSPRGGTVDILWDDEPAPAVAAPASPPPLPPPVAAPPVTAPSPPPPPEPAPSPPAAMNRRAFAELLAIVERTFFDLDKLAIVRAARQPFTAAQAHALLSAFDMERERWQAFEILRRRLIDPENGHLLARSFFFPRDKRRVLDYFTHE